MKRLIALRPIHYRGRTYKRGEAIPANDAVMTAAWLKAGSAAWEDPPVKWEVPPAPPSAEALRQEAEHAACGVLEVLGISIADDAGRFVGEAYLTEQLRILGQSLAPDYEDVIPPMPGAPSQGELPEDHLLDKDSSGHFTRASLSRLTKAELLELAEDLKVDLSGCRTNAERVEALAAADAETALDGGDAPPEPDVPEAET